MEKVSNGKLKWLLWLAGIVFTILLTTIVALANAVIENDRIRAKEDIRVQIEAHRCYEELNRKVDTQYSDIIQRLARIEAKVER